MDAFQFIQFVYRAQYAFAALEKKRLRSYA